MIDDHYDDLHDLHKTLFLLRAKNRFEMNPKMTKARQIEEKTTFHI